MNCRYKLKYKGQYCKPYTNYKNISNIIKYVIK